MDTYYRLAKRKLQLSKTRSKIGKIGGNAPRVKVTDEQINEQTSVELGLNFDEFLRRNPQITNDIYKTSQHLTERVDWSMLDYCLPISKYQNCTSLYKILSNYDEILDGWKGA